jgi:hypothetical protein
LTKQNPTLEDLGLDGPVDKSPYGKAFDNYEPTTEDHAKTWVDSVKLPNAGPSNLVAGILAFFFGPVGLWYKGCWKEGFGWVITGLVLLPFVILIPYVNLFFVLAFWSIMIIHAVVADPKN